MTIEQVGARLYIANSPYSIKDRLKSIGCHWDADRRQWWIGQAKRAELEAIISSSSATEPKERYTPPTAEELAKKPCTGKAEYKGRTYYVVGHSRGTAKYLLTVLDCSISFWVPTSDCRITKTYPAREYKGRTEHQTVGGIRAFVEREKRAKAEGFEDGAHARAVRTGKCRVPGCCGSALPSGYCERCEFDEFDM